MAAALLGVAWSGAAGASELLDPGATVRWGLPVTTVLMELAAAVTLGALVLAAVVLPRGPAWPSMMLVAATAASVWALAAVAHTVLTYASIAGLEPTSPTFGNGLGLFVTSITLGRILLVTVVIAALVSVAAMLVTGPTGAAVAALVGAVALAVQAQTGHTAGSTNHDLAVSAMFVHLLAAAVWVGGLAALALVAHRLGRDLPTAVARWSPIAGWALAGVALSGLISSAIRLGGDLDGLTTRYGALLIVKVVLLATLGLLGLLHRRAVVAHLVRETRTGQPDGASRRAPVVFWRLVLVELAVMGAVSGVAVALGSTAPPAPQLPTGALTPAEIVTGHVLPPPPTFDLWLTSFMWDAIPAMGALAAAVVYVRWVRRLAVRGDRWPIHRTLVWLAGLLLFTWATSGGAAVYWHVLFSAHMVQHMVLVMVVPIFLALAAPVTLASRALPVRRDSTLGPREMLLGLVHSRYARFFAHPVVAAVNFAGSMVAFYYTPAFELALTTYIGHLAMIIHFTLAGYLFVNALIGVDPGPTRPGYPVRLLLLFATMAFHAFFGIALVTDQTLLAPDWYGLLGRPWGPSAIEDQHIGGGIAWGISELPMLALAIGIALAWTKDDERTARRRDRAADRDGEAELNEYNAMLERMSRGTTPNG